MMDPRRARVFGQVADLYEQRRPGYPDALFDAVLAAPSGQVARALEVGAGTGRATKALALRGLRIEAVEPDVQMAAVARRSCAGLPVHVHDLAFEEWDAEPGAFDLVFGAQAWHWVDPIAGGAVAARALRPGGVLAVWWNRGGDNDGPVFAGIHEAFAREVPDPEGRPGSARSRPQHAQPPAAIAGLGAWRHEAIDWETSYGTQEYAELIQTHSDVRLLAPDARTRLVTAVAGAIEAAGGRFTFRYRTHLFTASKP
jgi:SAM-dependent methyltransferase